MKLIIFESILLLPNAHFESGVIFTFNRKTSRMLLGKGGCAAVDPLLKGTALGFFIYCGRMEGLRDGGAVLVAPILILKLFVTKRGLSAFRHPLSLSVGEKFGSSFFGHSALSFGISAKPNFYYKRDNPKI